MIALNLLWHQHQPDYRHPASGETILPWVRLHAVKGYADLLAILKRHDQAAMTVNFSGILLEQLQNYTQNGVTDTFARLSDRPAGDLTPEERAFVLKHFFSGNPLTLIRPHLRFDQLLAKRNSLVRLVGFDEAVGKFSDQELTDILVWFNLAWIGFTGQKRRDVIDLIAQGREYNHEQQRQVLEIHRQIARGVLKGYKQLADQGQIELTFTPYHHPILPLLIDLAGEGHRKDEDPLPDYRYPQDAEEQVRRGMRWYERCFGRMPRGAWPAEGSVSDAALSVFASAGVEWVATDQQNLPHELRGPLDHLVPRLWQDNGSRLCVFFRDTRLADNIGFEYAGWTGRVAGRHFVKMVLAMAEQSRIGDPVVTVALDGENPWEGYPDGGEGFLCALIEEVAARPELEFSTPSRLLGAGSHPVIEHVSAGSWINGNFDIWSRHAETRTAWRRLAQARLDLIDVCRDQVYEHLLAAEGSDWFWWYGDDFNTEQAEQFDELFRAHLINAYTAAGREVPDELYAPIISERLPKAVGEISALIEPQLDGRVSSFYEWRGAVRVGANQWQSSMARVTKGEISEFWYGFSTTALYIRLELSTVWRELLHTQQGRISLRINQGETELAVELAGGEDPAKPPLWSMALDQIVEIRLDLAVAGLKRDALAYLAVELNATEGPTARFPETGMIPIHIIAETYADEHWSV